MYVERGDISGKLVGEVVQRTRPSAIVIATLLIGLCLSACAGMRVVVPGQDQAEAACRQLLELQDGGEQLPVEDILAKINRAVAASDVAAKGNSEFGSLSSSINRLRDSLLAGDEPAAQSAWATVAQQCNNL